MPYADPVRQAEYQREWTARRRARWLAGKVCVICGSTEDLQVDHIDPRTKVSHHVWSWSQARREAELAKCQVLCGPHHKEKTKRENYPEMHGHNRYVKHGCRCGPCRADHAAVNKAWRASVRNGAMAQ